MDVLESFVLRGNLKSALAKDEVDECENSALGNASSLPAPFHSRVYRVPY